MLDLYLFVLYHNWNWLRGPIQGVSQQKKKTGGPAIGSGDSSLTYSVAGPLGSVEVVIYGLVRFADGRGRLWP